MSTYTYSGTAEQRRAQALGNMLNEGIDAVPTIASANEQAVRDAILAEVGAVLSGSGSVNFTSLGGYVALGASPPASGALRVDAATYAGEVLSSKNTTGTLVLSVAAGANATIATANSLDISNGGENKWRFSSGGGAGVSQLTALQATARIVGGSTNGLAIRNSGNTRDNLVVNDAGTIASFSDGTHITQIRNTGTSGELTAGGGVGSSTGDVWLNPGATTTAGKKMGIIYHNQTQFYSALEVANVAAGFGTLSLMKSGGQTVFGNSGTPGAGTYVTIAGSITAGSSVAKGVNISTTMVAAANNDALSSLRVLPAHTPAAYTGLLARGIEVVAFSTATFTTPADPIGVDIGVVTGTGATNGYGLKIGIPTGATNNYLIAASTPATFNVKADGTVTSAVAIVAGGNLGAGATSTVSWSSRSSMSSPADSQIKLANAVGTAFSDLYYGQQAGATTSHRIQKAVTGIGDAAATDVLVVTIPNGAHSARVRVTIVGSLGAGGAIGANEATGTVSYDLSVARTTGVNAVATISAAYGSAMSNVAGAATITVTGALSAVGGAVGATNTVSVQATISRGSGASTNHTAFVLAEVLNANATGISIA